jgi:hypothetical protein|tara:strand:- start:393 stop:569 length:177 start_codon:yes stop_codon:yes gene_type:complete
MVFVRMSVQGSVEPQGVPTQRNVKRNSVLVSQIYALRRCAGPINTIPSRHLFSFELNA